MTGAPASACRAIHGGRSHTMNKEMTATGIPGSQGTDSSVEMRTKKQRILSYKKGPVYMALKMVTPYDSENQTYGRAFPRITFLVDGRYIRMPLDSDELKELGAFISKVGEALEGVDIPDDRMYMDAIRRRIRACGGVIRDQGEVRT